MPDRHQAIAAIRDSWSRDTSAVPHDWTSHNPARGRCDASSFVFWELFGGDLVLAKVYVEGIQTEHHYWNRIGGVDVDLTLEQFTAGEELRLKQVLSSDYIRSHVPTMRTELRDRIDLLTEAVVAQLAFVDSG